MTSQSQWPEGRLVSVKLRDDLYTIAQVCRPIFMRFFRIAKRDGHWHDLDLGGVPILFTVPVLLSAPGALAGGQVDASVKPNGAPFERQWLAPNALPGGGCAGARLVESRHEESKRRWPVVKDTLSLPGDIDVIRRCQLTSDAKSTDLKRRLEHYFDTGHDLDPLKAKVFGVEPQVLSPGSPDRLTFLDADGGGTGRATTGSPVKKPARGAGAGPSVTSGREPAMLTSRTSARQFRALIAKLDPGVLALAEGKVTHPAFRGRCDATDGPRVEHGGGQPAGAPFLTLWESADVVTGVRETNGKLEFLTFDVEDPDAHEVVAHSSRGLLAHVFFELASDQDWRDEAEARATLKAAAATVGFRDLDEVVRIHRSRGWKPEEFRRFTRSL